MSLRLGATFAVLLSLTTVVPVDAHGTMLMPPPRNAVDSKLPGLNWGNGQNRTGAIESLGVQCKNGTEPCKPGQAVFWFSQGCTPGCKECDGNGTRFANWDHCAAERKVI